MIFSTFSYIIKPRNIKCVLISEKISIFSIFTVDFQNTENVYGWRRLILFANYFIQECYRKENEIGAIKPVTKVTL